MDNEKKQTFLTDFKEGKIIQFDEMWMRIFNGCSTLTFEQVFRFS